MAPLWPVLPFLKGWTLSRSRLLASLAGSHLALIALPLAASLITTPAAAVVKKKPARRAAPRAVKKPPTPPPLVAAPIIPGGFMVPKVVVLRATTPGEAEANAVWNLRAGLNVAALQCQFSPFLQTVRNYNDVLKHHGDELARAQATMVGHFRRYDKARALASFDQYTTRTYNSFSTLDAQYRFCDVAGWVGRRVLALPKGDLGREAVARADEMRQALSYQPLSPALAVEPLPLLAIAPFEADDMVQTAQH